MRERIVARQTEARHRWGRFCTKINIAANINYWHIDYLRSFDGSADGQHSTGQHGAGSNQQDGTQQIATVVASQLRLGPGFHERDREHLVAALESLDRHLARWRSERVDLRVSVKERETLNQRVTLEVWVPGCNPLIANSHEPNIDHALIEVRKVIVREIEGERSRREPHKGSVHQTH